MRLRYQRGKSRPVEATVLTDWEKSMKASRLLNFAEGKPRRAVGFVRDFSIYFHLDAYIRKTRQRPIEAANQAFNVAESENRKQIAKLSWRPPSTNRRFYRRRNDLRIF